MDHTALAAQIASELRILPANVRSTIALLDEGNTIPFLARYRKEQTGNLDEEQLRSTYQRLEYLRNLSTRRDEVIRALEEQGVLTDEIRASLEQATTLQRVDDIYRPFRPKRRTRGSVAREQGLEPLAAWLIKRDPEADPLEHAQSFINTELGVDTADIALAGARDIIAEDAADDPEVRDWARRHTISVGTLLSQAKEADAKTAYEQYYDYSEQVRRIPPHRVLAVNRGEKEDVLRVKVEVEAGPIVNYMQYRIAGGRLGGSPVDQEILSALEDSYARLLAPAVERDVRSYLTEVAEEQAIKVFSANLRSLLLTAPIRGKVVMGLDPAYRTGCKIAVVDATGRLIAVTVVYPTPPQRRVGEAEKVLIRLIEEHGVDVITIGNGTASREAEAFVAGMIPKCSRPVSYVIVNEAGASVYSASPLARDEFPDLDVSERSAVSIARRLQDPLAELVKIEPKAIGVGQYQHDVAQARLASVLDGVVESAVNSVGVDLNTASAPLLGRVAGLSPSVAKNVVTHRNEHGPFEDREGLLQVSRLGPKTFQQCAGFLRVPEGVNMLDNTAIHPESYSVARELIRELGFSEGDLTADSGRRAQLLSVLGGLDIPGWAQRLNVGEATLADIAEALAKPGRDPRDELVQPVLRTDVLTMDQLRPGMMLQGTVRNVVDFGAFVDIGVGQDGLVHVSEIADGYVRHPLDKLAVGDVVNVRVLACDAQRGRISLSMKTGDAGMP